MPCAAAAAARVELASCSCKWRICSRSLWFSLCMTPTWSSRLSFSRSTCMSLPSSSSTYARRRTRDTAALWRFSSSRRLYRFFFSSLGEAFLSSSDSGASSFPSSSCCLRERLRFCANLSARSCAFCFASSMALLAALRRRGAAGGGAAANPRRCAPGCAYMSLYAATVAGA